MPSIVHLEGWDHQADLTAITRGGGGAVTQRLNRLLADGGSVPGQDYAVTVHHAHTDSMALRITDPGAASTWRFTPTSTGQNLVTVLAFRYGQLPSAQGALLRMVDTAAISHDIQIRTSGALRVSVNGVNSADAGTVSTATWYILEAHAECAGTTHDVRWKVYPAGSPGSPLIAQRTDSATGLTDTSWNEIRVGMANTTATISLFLDDWLVSETAEDYPLGEHYVKLYKPNGKGTHVTSGAGFKNLAGTQISNSNPQNAHLDLADIPSVETTGITQNTATVDPSYLEFVLNSNAETAKPDAMRLIVTGYPTSTNACTMDARIADNDVETASMLFDVSATALAREYHCSTFTTRPNLAQLTAASLQASRIRIGYTTDPNPNPQIIEAFLMASFPLVQPDGMVGAGALGGGPTYGGTLSGTGGDATLDGAFLAADGATYGGTLSGVGAGSNIVVPSLDAVESGTLELLLGVANGATAFNPDTGWTEKLDLQQNLSSSSSDQTVFAAYRVVDTGATNAALGVLDDSSRWAAIHLLVSPAPINLVVSIPAANVQIGGKAGDQFVVSGSATSDGGTPAVTVNGVSVAVGVTGSWQRQITLGLGVNTVTVIGTLGAKVVTIVRLITVVDPDNPGGGTGGSGDPGTLSGDAVRISEILEESGLDPK